VGGNPAGRGYGADSVTLTASGAEAGQDSDPVGDRSWRRIERELQGRRLARAYVLRVGQRELPGPAGRAVVPGHPYEGFADLGVIDLDRRAKFGALVGHRQERALDAPRATAGDAHQKLGAVLAERSARRRSPVGRSAVGARQTSECRRHD